MEQVGSGTRNESMRLRRHRFDYRISNEGDISSRLLNEESYCNEARDPTPVVGPDLEAGTYSRIKRLDRDSNPDVKRRCAHQIRLENTPIMKRLDVVRAASSRRSLETSGHLSASRYDSTSARKNSPQRKEEEL